MVDEPKEPTPEEPKTEQTPPAEPESSVEVTETKDEKGVDYKNRYAESERKREQQSELMEEMTLRMNQLEQKLPPSAAAPQPAQKQASKSDMDEMISMGPKAYNEKLQRDYQQNQNEAAAINLIKEKFGVARAQFGISKVLDYAQKNLVNLHADPVRAVTKILAEMEKPKTQTSAEDRKKTAEAIKNKPEGGKRPPATPVSKESELMNNVRNRGSIDDVAAALAEQWRQAEQK